MTEADKAQSAPAPNAQTAGDAAAANAAPSAWQFWKLDLPPPGSFDEMTREKSRVFASDMEVFDGAKFELTKTLKPPAFQVVHNITMGASEQPPTYSFGVKNMLGSRMFMSGTVDTNGRVSGHAVWQALDTLALRLQFGVYDDGHRPNYFQWDVEQRGDNYTLGAKLAGDFVYAEYAQSVTEALAAAVQLTTNASRLDSTLTAAVRYGTPTYVFTGSVNSDGESELSYLQAVNDEFTLATELIMTSSFQSRFRIGHEMRLPWGTTFRGQIDSNGKVIGVLDEELVPGFHFLVAATLDHYAQDYKFGVGLVAAA